MMIDFQKLLTADHQIKEKLSVIRDMENEIGNLRRIMDEYKQVINRFSIHFSI